MRFGFKIFFYSLSKLLLPDQRRILNFTLPQYYLRDNGYAPIDSQWNVHARKQPLITKPLHILDLPDVQTNLCKYYSKLLTILPFKHKIFLCDFNNDYQNYCF